MLSVRPLFMGLLHLVLVSVQRLWRVGAEGEEVTAATAAASGGKEKSPGGGGGKNKAVNDYFTDLWNLLDKLRVLQERNDWQRIGDFLLFVSRSAPASKPTTTAPIIPPSLASVVTAREGKLYAGLLPRLVAHLQ